MRKLVALLAGLLALPAFAADRAMLDDTDTWKLYTAPEVSFSDINGSTEALLGLGIGTILNNQWTFGLAAHINPNDLGGDADVGVEKWKFWNAGGEVGYIFAPASLLHLNASLFVGGGQIKVEDSFFGGDDSDGFLIVEPRLSLCLNLHETWELGIGVGYRWVDGVNFDGLDDDDLSNVTGTVFLRATEF